MRIEQQLRAVPKNHGNGVPQTHLFVDFDLQEVQHRSSDENAIYRLRHAVLRIARLEGRNWGRQTTWVSRSAEQIWGTLLPKLNPKRPIWAWCESWQIGLPLFGLQAMLDSGELSMTRQVTLKGRGKNPVSQTVTRALPCVLEDSVVIVGLRAKNGGTLLLLDSRNWLPWSLQRSAEILGMEPPEVSGQHLPQERSVPQSVYRVDVLQEAIGEVIDAVRQQDLGVFRWTLPSQSLACFRHTQNPHKVFPHHHPDAERLERQSYYGGRLDLNFVGRVGDGGPTREPEDAPEQPRWREPVTGPVAELDVQSMYLSVVLDRQYPVRLTHLCLDGDPDAERLDILGPDCCATVLIRDNVKRWPLRTDRGIVYPVGTYWTTLAGPELGAALAAGVVQRVCRWARYEVKPALNAFAEKCLNIRFAKSAEVSEMAKAISKLLGNSLHGKFGQQFR